MNPTTIAVTVVELANEGRFTDIEARFAKRLRKAVSARSLRADWTAALGAITTIGEPTTEPSDAGLVRVSVPVIAERGPHDVVMSVDDNGTLHGLRLTRSALAWQSPSYADPTRFAEQDIVLAAPPVDVAGTLTVPIGPGPWPAAVLLSGGGPFDRDETSGVNKPLKDLAWGLASRGVAVIRFDLVTHARPEFISAPGFTMSQEYVPHALTGVRLLRQQSTVDSTRIFLVGHSMGGRVAPRIAAADTTIAGLVVLAGDASPMHHSAARVARRLAALDPDLIPQTMLDQIDEQIAFIEGPDLSPTTPAADLPFGWPGSYWLELRDDDPVSTAAALGKPMFIAQGARDYQVTVADDLTRWQTGLADQDNVTFAIYDADDHLFFPGDGPSTPASYAPAQHVDEALITDVATWLTLPR
ncbi:MAG TPA: alpha/beta fold hydrolase [Pseudonocardiaceae bacterium]